MKMKRTISIYYVWTAGDCCSSDYPGRANTPRQQGSMDSCLQRQERSSVYIKQTGTEFSWLLARDQRTKGFLCCPRCSQPTRATGEWAAERVIRREPESLLQQRKMLDTVCIDLGGHPSHCCLSYLHVDLSETHMICRQFSPVWLECKAESLLGSVKMSLQATGSLKDPEA